MSFSVKVHNLRDLFTIGILAEDDKIFVLELLRVRAILPDTDKAGGLSGAIGEGLEEIKKDTPHGRRSSLPVHNSDAEGRKTLS